MTTTTILQELEEVILFIVNQMLAIQEIMTLEMLSSGDGMMALETIQLLEELMLQIYLTIKFLNLSKKVGLIHS